jgi:hypothetical protein
METMELTKIIKEWMNDEGWEDELALDSENLTSRVATKMRIENQSYRLYIDTNEKQKTVDFFFYTPFEVPPDRYEVMAAVLNRVNFRNAAGRFAFKTDGQANPIQYLYRLDTEGSALSKDQVSYSLSLACTTVGEVHSLLASAAMTKESANTLLATFENKDSS